MYKILKDYLRVDYELPENILLALIKEEELPLKQTLQQISYIHYGFVDRITPKREEDG